MDVLLDMEADMDKTYAVCACGRVDTRDWLGTTHAHRGVWLMGRTRERDSCVWGPLPT
jgi:hypothetical protein